MVNIHWNVGPNENYIILVVSQLQAGFLFQFLDIANLAIFSKKLSKLVIFTLEKQNFQFYFNKMTGYCLQGEPRNMKTWRSLLPPSHCLSPRASSSQADAVKSFCRASTWRRKHYPSTTRHSSPFSLPSSSLSFLGRFDLVFLEAHGTKLRYFANSFPFAFKSSTL